LHGSRLEDEPAASLKTRLENLYSKMAGLIFQPDLPFLDCRFLDFHCRVIIQSQ